MALYLESYGQETTYSVWCVCMIYFNQITKLREENKVAHIIILIGFIILAEIKLLYAADYFKQIGLDTIVYRLKTKLILVHMYMFNTRLQCHNERMDNFISNPKMQVERCVFAHFKEFAKRGQIVAFINDKELRQRLSNEDRLSSTILETIFGVCETARTVAGVVEHCIK